LGKGLAGESAAQRATKVAAGGLSIAACVRGALELNNKCLPTTSTERQVSGKGCNEFSVNNLRMNFELLTLVGKMAN